MFPRPDIFTLLGSSYLLLLSKETVRRGIGQAGAF